MSVIVFEPKKQIVVSAIQKNDLKLRAGLIAPATEDTSTTLAPEHTSEPIKSMDDILNISNFEPI